MLAVALDIFKIRSEENVSSILGPGQSAVMRGVFPKCEAVISLFCHECLSNSTCEPTETTSWLDRMKAGDAARTVTPARGHLVHWPLKLFRPVALDRLNGYFCTILGSTVTCLLTPSKRCENGTKGYLQQPGRCHRCPAQADLAAVIPFSCSRAQSPEFHRLDS
jgi:hypothetical protein